MYHADTQTANCRQCRTKLSIGTKRRHLGSQNSLVRRELFWLTLSVTHLPWAVAAPPFVLFSGQPRADLMDHTFISPALARVMLCALLPTIGDLLDVVEQCPAPDSAAVRCGAATARPMDIECDACPPGHCAGRFFLCVWQRRCRTAVILPLCVLSIRPRRQHVCRLRQPVYTAANSVAHGCYRHAPANVPRPIAGSAAHPASGRA